MASKKQTRKWEVFAGRNKFWCDGRLMSAPHNGVFYLTVVLITFTSTLFFIFDCPFLSVHISPAIPCAGAALLVFTMSALLRTSFTDPGIIPRATSHEAAYIEQQIEVPNSCNSPTLRPPPRTREVVVKGQPVKLKYCFTCKMFRPPRASHCSLCDNCVDRFDHHCPWVGNCVGRRNYRYFYMFIVSLAFLAVFIFACAITHIVMLRSMSNSLLEALRQSPVSVVVGCVCFFSVWSVLGLAGFHTYLAGTDQTTNEDIKGSFSSRRGQSNPNPYARGNVCYNCWHILCGPMAPSLIDRRGLVTNDSRENVSPTVTEPVTRPPASARLTEPPPPAVYRSVDVDIPMDGLAPRGAGSYTNLFNTGEEMELSPDVAPCHNAIQPPGENRQYQLDNRHTYPNGTLGYTGSKNGGYTGSNGNNVGYTGSNGNNVGYTASNGNNIGFTSSNGNIGYTPQGNHVYSNLALHALDLDPVMLTGSKENLVSGDSGRTRVADHNRNVTQASHAAHAPNATHLLSASRLRLLHDTTMIDTALDLDSLDGSTLSAGTNTV